MAMETEQTTDGLVIGRNAVAELLAGGREIEHVLVANGVLIRQSENPGFLPKTIQLKSQIIELN